MTVQNSFRLNEVLEKAKPDELYKALGDLRFRRLCKSIEKVTFVREQDYDTKLANFLVDTVTSRVPAVVSFIARGVKYEADEEDILYFCSLCNKDGTRSKEYYTEG